MNEISALIGPRIGIVLLNLNSYEDMARCLASLKFITYSNVDIIVIDNGSSDDSASRIKNEFPNARHFQLPSNQGSTGGRNFGITKALDFGCSDILLLDDDTIVTPNFLEPLVSRLESNPAIAAVTGKIYAMPNELDKFSNTIWFAGCERKWHTWFNHRGMDEKDTAQYDIPSPVESMPACLMLLSGTAIKRVGKLSDDYFVYWEEADWCIRAHQAGYKCYYEPQSIIFHNYKSGEPGEETPFYNYLQYRNALIFNADHNSFMRQVQFFTTLPILLSHRTVRSLLAKNVIGAKAAVWGILDFFRGYRGKKGLRERGLLN